MVMIMVNCQKKHNFKGCLASRYAVARGGPGFESQCNNFPLVAWILLQVCGFSQLNICAFGPGVGLSSTMVLKASKLKKVCEISSADFPKRMGEQKITYSIRRFLIGRLRAGL